MRREFKILDLFCKAGGCSRGYFDSGFNVTGVDIEFQEKYPYTFIHADAFDVLNDSDFIRQFDAIHASPVCKKYSTITRTSKTVNNHPDQIAELRTLLNKTELPYIIENVPGSPLKKPFMLCGTMFGLNIIRHRHFEINWLIDIDLFKMRCFHSKRVVKHGRKPERDKHYAAATGHFSDVEFVQESMGIDWMGQKELSQAIPPAYTNYIGTHLLKLMP